jgi:lysozyme family protein
MQVDRRSAAWAMLTGPWAVASSAVAVLTTGEPAAADSGEQPDERFTAFSQRAEKLNLLRLGAPAATLSADIDPALTYSDLLSNSLANLSTGDLDSEQFTEQLGQRIADLDANARDATPELLQGPPPPFRSLKEEYRTRFSTCVVDPAHRSEISHGCRRIIDPNAVRIYKQVEITSGVPWYLIGALHYREASLNFLGHLHNGDFLKRRTYHVPPGRPNPPEQWPIVPWNAEQAWIVSANDALTRLASLTDTWTLEWMLYACESYNGWGYRNHPGFISPYLWNYTDLYKGGGYPADGVWSATYHSRQAGLVSIIKSLVEIAPAQISLSTTP